MIVHFGLHLDGMRPAPAATIAGEVTLGPSRFLDLLELRLGLPPAYARPGQALLAYQACLAELDGLDRFYRRSLAVDAVGVARTLLAWRAHWYEHGWSGRFTGEVSKRLGDIAAVEALAQHRVPLTHGQRLMRVLAALDEGLATSIERIVLHEHAAELPKTWQMLLDRFDVKVADGTTPRPLAAAGTDLGRVQRSLLDRLAGEDGAARAPEILNRDNTLIVVRAISRDLSAQALAEYLLGKPDAAGETVLIAERDGIIVDNALERVSLPRAGFQHPSRFRAVTQVLKLCLALVWEPIDPRLLLQFLIHPVGPLPRGVRSELAAAVAKEPGVGGTAWRAALERIAERERERHGKSHAEIEALRREIAYWLESERYAPRGGAPTPKLLERTARCTQWLMGRLRVMGDEDDSAALYAAAVAQGEALGLVLADLHARGQTLVARIAFEQLVDEVGGLAPDPAAFGQAGHVRATTDPTAITQAWRRVIWWDLAPHTAAPSYPWSEAELAELEREGVALPSIDERIRARLRRWLRPILNAERELILVIHDRDEGHHPLWTQITSAFERFTEIRVEDALLAGENGTAIPVLEVPTGPLPLKPLPAPQRWWRLPDDCPRPQTASESYSSLSSLIYHPHRWVLERGARLQAGRAADLTRGSVLYGNLAHRLFERFFTTFPNWASLDESVINAWLAELVPALLRQEGALLCEPGHGVVSERVQAQLEHGFNRLLFHLRSAQLEQVAPEQPGSAPFEDTRLDGRIDLLLLDRRGREIVLDVKWGGQDYRVAELAANRHLQLATYAYLRRTPAGDWPYQAFFIAATGNVIAPDRTVFPNALVAPSSTGETTNALWNRVTATYRWRRAQLAAGRIEVTAAGTEADDDSAPPPNALDVDVGPDRFDPFTWLTGWEDGV